MPRLLRNVGHPALWEYISDPEEHIHTQQMDLKLLSAVQSHSVNILVTPFSFAASVSRADALVGSLGVLQCRRLWPVGEADPLRDNRECHNSQLVLSVPLAESRPGRVLKRSPNILSCIANLKR